MFDPFHKPLAKLTASDLARLREVAEGWYIEYKQKCTNALTAAKSLSAFANSSGGWLFYGIAEHPKEKTAEQFIGIPTEDVPQVENWLQQAASGSVSPTPYYEHLVINGPAPEIDLPSDKSIVVVRIPQGNETPYIHGSGRIYRRIGNASDPIHETDRHSLDLLWQRSQNRREQFANFINRECELSQAEESASYITLFFFSDPWDSHGLQSSIDFKEFSNLMKDSSLKSGYIPFDNIFTSSDGLIARQVKNNDPFFRGFIWKVYRNCVHEVTIPLSSVLIGDNQRLRQFMEGYEYASSFFEECVKSGLHNGWLVDLSHTYFILSSILLRLHRLLEMDGIGWPIFFKGRISGAWRTVPFLDLSHYAKFVQENGIPVVQEQVCLVPQGSDPDSCFELVKPEIDESIKDVDDQMAIASSVEACQILLSVARAFGLHPSALGLDFESNDGVSDYISEWIEMGERAGRVSQQRAMMRS